MKWLVLILTLCLTSCHFPSKMTMEGSGGRNAYNVEVQKTNAEEMLLNLVRLRYYDSPFFLEVSSVTSQFTMRNLAVASIQLPGFDKTNPMSLGGETQWTNQPTIQYSPLQGKEFANQLMQPLDINTIQQVIYSGWGIDRVFALTVQNFQEFPNVPREGLEPEELIRHQKFHQLIKLMTELQIKGDLQIGIGQNKTENVDKPNLQFAFPSGNKVSEQMAELLSSEKSVNGKYVLNVVVGFDDKGNIGLLPRSLLSCMHYLSKGIVVPQKDIDDKKVSFSAAAEDKKEDIERIFKDLIVVCSSVKKPKDAYVAIKYRDFWFYINDDDIHSKKTFMLLLELYNLQSGRGPGKGPILTLPLGVG
ncbi:MAG: hypothetical protein K1060chlam1_00038 [Candidatus Anoxychlamydiales bacterium]|nr:hypothetical protein [Candidatus Anoxychlamydiales bacterium]